jgi:two-component system response regulator NreC
VPPDAGHQPVVGPPQSAPGNGTQRLRILLVDDHAVVRAGLRFVLETEEEFEVVGEAATTDEAIVEIERHRPDTVFLDIAMPTIGGVELCRRIHDQYPETHVIILTLHEGEEYFTQALQAGASGYLVKGSSTDELIAALRAVQRGGTYINPILVTSLVRNLLQSRSAGAFAGLSEREREVVELVVNGLHNQEIAQRLGIRATTVQTHRSNAMEKLGLKDYGELVRFAIRHGVIQP